MEDSINRAGLLTLSTYNAYANGLVLDVAAKMTSSELTAESGFSRSTVLRLLNHMFVTEKFFLACCQGRRQTFEQSPPEYLAQIVELRQAWQQVAQERQQVINSYSEDDLTKQITVAEEPSFCLARWQLLLQSLLHSAHHRGELSILMTQLGYPLPTLDIIIRFAEESGQTFPWLDA